MRRLELRIVDVVPRVELLADEVQALELVEDVEPRDEVRGVRGQARGGVGEVRGFRGGEPREAEVFADGRVRGMIGLKGGRGERGGGGEYVPYKSAHARSTAGEGSCMYILLVSAWGLDGSNTTVW